MTLPGSITSLHVLASTPYMTSSSLRNVIDAFGTEATTADSLQAVDNEDGAVLVVTSAPAHVLAAYIQSAPDMRTALAQWIDWAEDLLQHQRRNRRKITLVDLELLTRGGAEDFDRLTSRLHTTFSRLPESCVTSYPQNALVLLAIVALSADHRAARLEKELEAAMFCPTAETSTIDLTERVLADLRRNGNELSLQREVMALQVSEIEKQARLVIAEEQKTQRSTQALSQEKSLVSQLRKQLHERLDLEPLLSAARGDIETLISAKQKHLTEFSQILARILHVSEMTKWPWLSRRDWQIKIVRDCGIVDANWYLQHHQDAAKAGAEPFTHYIDHGVKEGRPPNAAFL